MELVETDISSYRNRFDTIIAFECQINRGVMNNYHTCHGTPTACGCQHKHSSVRYSTRPTRIAKLVFLMPTSSNLSLFKSVGMKKCCLACTSQFGMFLSFLWCWQKKNVAWNFSNLSALSLNFWIFSAC